MRVLRRWFVGVLLMGSCVVAAQPVQESMIKAAFVYNFVLFTDWPEKALTGAPSINICVNAASEMNAALQVLNGKPVRGMHVKVLQRASLEKGFSQCHVIFVDHLDRQNWQAIKKNLSSAQVLTISDDASTGADGAMIWLSLNDNRMVFDIDQTKARHVQLTFSSKLLRLARSVR